jgi:hypothetical protein
MCTALKGLFMKNTRKSLYCNIEVKGGRGSNLIILSHKNHNSETTFLRTERCIEFSLEQPYFFQSILNALTSFDLNDLEEPKWKF